jgi:uncharacterized protein (TIGR03437 family)
VDPPPKITAIAVSGGNDGTTANNIPAPMQRLLGQVSFTPVPTDVTEIFAYDTGNAGPTAQTSPVKAGDNAILFNIPFKSAQAFVVSLINSSDQVVSFNSAKQTPEYVAEPDFFTSGNTLTFSNFAYSGASGDTLSVSLTADFPGTISPSSVVCTQLPDYTARCPDVNLPLPLPASGHVTAVAKIMNGTKTVATSTTGPVFVAAEEALTAGQPVTVEPLTLIPASDAGKVTPRFFDMDPADFFLGVGSAANSGRAAQSQALSTASEPQATGLGTAVAPSSLIFLNGTVNFSPSIPNTGTFTAQIVYKYSSAVLPDDPGFNPANLELVSYDPATQQLLTYPSTVNTAAQTVTATVSGLAPYYGLAVPASTLGSALNLPFDPQHESAVATVALLNTGTVPVNTSLTARGFDGSALAPNPTTGPILPGQQIARSFDSLGVGNGNAGWVQAYADAGTAGFALLSDPSGFEGLALTGSSNSLVLSGMQLASGQFTELDVANSTPFQNSVTLELHDLTGALRGKSKVMLGPKGSFSSTLEAEFTNVASPLQGYVIVRGTERLTASALIRSTTALAAINGQPLSRGSSGPTTLYAPHFLAGGGFSSRLEIANPTALDAHVQIQANKDDGTLFAKAISVTIKAGAAYSGDVGTLLGLNPKTGMTGSFTISSDVSGLVGDVALSDAAPSPFHSSAIALAPPLATAVIPYVYNTSDSPTTLYVLNTGTAKATVQVGVLAANGTTVGQTTLSIPAGGRSAQTLSTLVAASAGQTGGAIQITSNQPVAAAAMILPVSPSADFAAIPAAPSSLGSPGAGPKPSINAGGVVNAASFTSTLARGSLASIFGTNLASGVLPAVSLPLPVSLQGTFVTVGGVPAPLVFEAPGQINFQVPFEVPTGSTAPVVVTLNGAASAAATVTLSDYAVGVFGDAASKLAIVVHGADNSLVTAANPAVPGETVVVYATGVGKLNNPPRSGTPSPGSALATSVDPPTITVGGSNATVLFSGLTPGFVGLIQFNITLPSSLPSGSLPLVIQFPSNSSPAVSLPVKGNR